jgi:short-subunit dehydrogenase involved in D-alanine esterification of teichoic acids
MKESPDIDCVFLNAGIQNKYDVAKPETVSIKAMKAELDTKFTGMVALANAFLPFMEEQSKTIPASIIM